MSYILYSISTDVTCVEERVQLLKVNYFTMYNIDEKVVFVTGGANGIGQCIVREFLKDGAKHVALLDIDEKSGEQLENEMRSLYGDNKVLFIKGDVSNDSDLFGAYNTIKAEHGYLDIIINNAGVCDESPLKYKKEIEINFTSTVTSTLKAIEFMRVDAGGRGGTVVNISSITALQQRSPTFFIYAATKSAILQFSTSIGMEAYDKRTKVRIITVCIGQTDSDLKNKALMYDNTITIDEIKETLRGQGAVQTAETAAKGIVESYRRGESGSTWLLNNNKVVEITETIKEGYKVLERDIIE